MLTFLNHGFRPYELDNEFDFELNHSHIKGMPTFINRMMHFPIFCIVDYGIPRSDSLPKAIQCAFLILHELRRLSESH